MEEDISSILTLLEEGKDGEKSEKKTSKPKKVVEDNAKTYRRQVVEIKGVTWQEVKDFVSKLTPEELKRTALIHETQWGGFYPFSVGKVKDKEKIRNPVGLDQLENGYPILLY